MKRKFKSSISCMKSMFCRGLQIAKSKFIVPLNHTQPGIALFFKGVISIVLARYLCINITEQWFHILFAIPTAVITYLLLNLAIFLLTRLRKILKAYETSTIFLVAIFLYTMYYFALYGNTSKYGAILFAIVVIIVELLFSRSIWAIFHNKQQTRYHIILASITLVCNITLVWFLFSEGLEKIPYDQLLSIKTDAIRNNTICTNQDREFKVSTITYGVDKHNDIKTNTINLSKYTEYNGSIAEYVRETYWGYELEFVPIAGTIWYPEVEEECPILFIVHGNHLMTTKSYLGYAYLGEYLASKGYIVVSVDEAFLNGYIDNGMIGENDARAILLLENIKELLRQNHNTNSLLYQRIDEEKIAICGHSRGGEAVSIAAMFNQYDVYPDNGQVKFDYNFQIQTVIAISPTCDQYKAAGREIILNDINYFLIHGSNDMDVTEFMGLKQYENVKFSGERRKRKAYLYIAGANHGQFNTCWGRYDISMPIARLLNTASIMKGEMQRDILKTYIKACLDLTLKEITMEESFFVDCSTFQDMPQAVYIQGYQNSKGITICDYEEDSVINKGTIEGSRISASGLYWNEKRVTFDDVDQSTYADRADYAVRLHWVGTNKSSYTIDLNHVTNLPKQLCRLRFDVFDLDDSKVNEIELESLDFTVVLVDRTGTEYRYRLKDYQLIYPPIAVNLSKIDAILGKTVYKHHFQTVQIPIDEISEGLQQIRFEFDQSENGHIMIDDIIVETE